MDKDTLFDPRHLDSIAGSAVTLHHPKEKITPGNYKKYAVGQTGTKIIKREDLGTIEIVTVIGDEEAINSVRNRDATCLSEAYDCIVKPFHQHFKQFSRLCNHNSLVPLGRANKAKLHLDSSDSFLYGFHVDDSEVDRVILPTLQSIKFTPRSEV